MKFKETLTFFYWVEGTLSSQLQGNELGRIAAQSEAVMLKALLQHAG